MAHCEPLTDSDEAHHAAELTNRFVEESAKILDASDVNVERRAARAARANVILTRDGGDHLPVLQSIDDRFGPEWGCFVEMPVERGIAKMLGMHPVAAPRLGSTWRWMSPSAQYAAWARLAADALAGYDALYVHIKGPDVPAHDGRAEDKRDVISAIDAGFFSEVLAFPRPHDHDRGGDGRSLHLVRPEGTHGGSRPAPGERRRGAVRRFHVVRRASVCGRGAGASPRYRYLAPARGPDACLSPR